MSMELHRCQSESAGNGSAGLLAGVASLWEDCPAREAAMGLQPSVGAVARCGRCGLKYF